MEKITLFPTGRTAHVLLNICNDLWRIGRPLSREMRVWWGAKGSLSFIKACAAQAAELQQFSSSCFLSRLLIPATLLSTSLSAIFHCQNPPRLDVFLMVRHIKTEQNAQITDIWCVGSLTAAPSSIAIWFVAVASWVKRKMIPEL